MTTSKFVQLGMVKRGALVMTEQLLAPHDSQCDVGLLTLRRMDRQTEHARKWGGLM